MAYDIWLFVNEEGELTSCRYDVWDQEQKFQFTLEECPDGDWETELQARREADRKFDDLYESYIRQRNWIDSNLDKLRPAIDENNNRVALLEKQLDRGV